MVDISLPSTIQDLEYGAFISTNIGRKIEINANFMIPESVDIIEAEAFAGIDARFVSVNPVWNRSFTIQSKAFSNCDSLEYFWFYGQGPESLSIAVDAFSGCNSTLTIISGFVDDDLAAYIEQYALNHGFKYLEDEKYWGDG